MTSTAPLDAAAPVSAGRLRVFPIAQEELEGMVNVLLGNTERPRTEMDFADASLVCLAEDTGVTTIMPPDVRDFSRYHLAGGREFDML